MEGQEDRPAVVVLAIAVGEHFIQVTVAPITHSLPRGEGGAIEIPPAVKAQLGLDQERSWIVVTEVNRFTWPGPDIRPVKGRDTPLYGAIPAKLFAQVRQAISNHVKAHRLTLSPRTE